MDRCRTETSSSSGDFYQVSQDLLGYIIENIFKGVPVERHIETLFIENMTDKTDRTPQHKKSIERTGFDELVDFALRVTKSAPHVHHEHTHGTVHVKDEIVLLPGRRLFYFQCIIQQPGLRETSPCIPNDTLDAQIGVAQ